MFHRHAVALILIAVSALAQQADIKTNSSEVILDLIVRDKRGRPVKDLTPSEISIQENGKTFSPATMRLVIATAAAPGGDAEKPAPSKAPTAVLNDAMRQVKLVSFLFEPLPRESARLAFDTAQELSAKAAGPNVFFNVLQARERLRIVQPFTNDPAQLAKAFRAVTSLAGYKQVDEFSSLAMRNLEKLAIDPQDFERLQRGQLPVNTMGQSNTDPTDVIRARQARVLLDMQSLSESMQRQYAGRTSFNSLRAAVRAMASIPGRKTIIYICRGITSHPSLSQTFLDLSEAANAAGVSIYAVDATGLEISERTREAAQMLARAAQASMETRMGDGSQAVTREQAMAFETAEQSAMANPSTLLAELAAATGGLVLSDSNDAKKMAQMIADDISSYWEVTYKPEIETWDGSFHPIAVKVNRKAVKVQARKGYFALPPGTRGQVAPFEVPLLSVIQSKDPVDGLRFEAVTADLLREGELTRGDMTVEMPLEQFTAEQDAAAALFRYRAAVLALFRNAQGEVVDRQSQPVNYQGPLDKLESSKSGLFHWRYAYKLPPGDYTVEIALQDRVGLKLGVRKIPVTIASIPENELAVSSISWVRPDPAASKVESFEPLRVGETELTPRATRRAALAGAKEGGMPLYFLVHRAAASGAEPPALEAAILRDGQLSARMPIEAGSALPQGTATASHYVVTLPWSALEPGAYEIRIEAKQGGAQASRAIKFDLAPAPGYQPPPMTKSESSLSPDAMPAAVLRFGELKLAAATAEPNAEERGALVESLRRRSAEWGRSLIDFVCLQITDRFVDRAGKGQFLKADTLREMVTYAGGKETYERLHNGNANYNKDAEVPKGVRSFGEFGGLMRGVLSDEAGARLEWKSYAELDGQRVHVFDFQVSQEKSMYKLTQESPFRMHKPAYSGQILAELDTMHVRRISLRTAEIPEKFPFQEATHEIDYSFQRLGGDSFLLPSKSVMQTRVGKRTIVRSEMEFSNYRKWSSESKIRFDVADPPE